MNIHYTEPLSRAWLRMKILLFRPFDLGLWFVLGFTAFLASLADGAGGGGSNAGTRFDGSNDFESIRDVAENSFDSVRNFLADSLAFGLVMMLLTGLLVLLVLLLWLSSRGKFMFLDNLVHRRSEVTRPWSEYASEGNSLFVWQLVYALVVLTVMGLLGLFGVLTFAPLLAGDVAWMVTAPLAILAGTLGFVLIVALCYVEFFLSGFVVPIMHKHRVSTTRAWSIFLAVFKEHPGSFVACGIFYLLISILGSIALFFGGLVTCCIGLLLLAIPYIGSVVSLPMSVTLRYYTLDFLGQFGPEFQLLEPVVDGPRNGAGPYSQPEPGPAAEPEPDPESPGQSVEFDADGTVIRTEDIGQDSGGDEPRLLD